MGNKNKVAVSACLIGKNVKYDGKNNYNQAVMDYLEDKEVFPICPEVLGGLTIPRIPSEIKNGKVFNQEGLDVTKQFEDGAKKALQILLDNNISVVILKAKSPSCGYQEIYDGSFNHKVISGNGIFTSLALKHNIKVLTEFDFFNKK